MFRRAGKVNIKHMGSSETEQNVEALTHPWECGKAMKAEPSSRHPSWHLVPRQHSRKPSLPFLPFHTSDNI